MVPPFAAEPPPPVYPPQIMLPSGYTQPGGYPHPYWSQHAVGHHAFPESRHSSASNRIEEEISPKNTNQDLPLANENTAETSGQDNNDQQASNQNDGGNWANDTNNGASNDNQDQPDNWDSAGDQNNTNDADDWVKDNNNSHNDNNSGWNNDDTNNTANTGWDMNDNGQSADNQNSGSGTSKESAQHSEIDLAALTNAARDLYGPHGPYYSFRALRLDEPKPDALEEPRYDVPKALALTRGSTKQVQPGPGYRYYKRRLEPEYIDSMDNPYARFVFKYRTKGRTGKLWLRITLTYSRTTS